MAPKSRNSRKPLIVEHDKEYSAKICLLVGVLYVGALNVSSRRRILKPDRYRGVLSYGKPSKRDLALWQAHIGKQRGFIEADHVRLLFRYEYDAPWGDHLKWWHWSEAVAKVIVSTLQVIGPLPGHANYLYTARVDALGRTFSFYDRPNRFMPRLEHGTGFAPHQKPSDLSSFPLLFSRLYEVQAERFANLARLTSSEKLEAHGSRLECSLYMFGCAMQPLYQQDIAFRMHIAIEALFAAKAMNQSTVALVSAILLHDTHDPRDVLNWVRTIYDWRNKFVHGNEPPYQYPSGSKYVSRLRDAGSCATRLLTSLYNRILRSDELLSIFARPMEEKEFLDKLFTFTAVRR